MDRVICGDVGFGKTEVALRAVAAVVFSEMQVALAVPTTVLARQHAANFRSRFAPFGVEVALLSRFSSAKARIKAGAAQILIGTQAVATNDVEFSRLGLVVIDEEQHFGTAEKRKLFELSRGIHRLAMSATPIPRTLAGAFTGLNELSVIASAPVQRTPVVTKLASITDSTITSALQREHRRGGQSFVICPRISDIEPMLERLRRAVPELTILCLHGRLPAQDIDEIMACFVEGKADVLLATNIIENGIDIPRANTILICWPERFGLAQLHQLRGRVGRGGTRAFAYLLTDSKLESARKRMSALTKLAKPGAGLEISERDLELRGAGDLLSEEQSGHINIFGPALYHHLLGLAMKGKYTGMNSLTAPEIHIGVSEQLPLEYVSNEATRLDIYLRLAKASHISNIEDIEDELEARFGKMPDQVLDLIAVARLRLACRRLGVIRLEAGPAGVSATFASPVPGPLARPLLAHGERALLKTKIRAGQRIAAAKKLLLLLNRRSDRVPRRPALAKIAGSGSSCRQ
jgi:transcription-repair coupling factor (superfamily II helicase)